MRKLAASVACLFALDASAQAAASNCDAKAPAAPFCAAVRGARAGGWLPQGRSEVMAPHAMVVASQPLAAQAGLQIMMRGGNAIDAAVATSAVLNLMEPMMVGLAGDLFAVIYVAREKKVYVLNASGKAPTGATVAHFEELGYRANPNNWGPSSGMPIFGILAVTVPGAAWGWEEVLKRFGKLTFKEVLQPAIDYAENGFPVSERIAGDWHLPNAMPLRKCCTELDPDSVATWYIDGRPVAAGRSFRNPDLAKTFRMLQKEGRDAFYKGEIARAIVAKSQKLGGTMTLEDLASYQGEWTEPAASAYHGYDLLELAPPAQAWATNEILNILEACVPKWAPGQTLASLGPANPLYWHFMVEAKKLAYADLYAYNADPHVANVPMQKLLSKSYAESLCPKVDPKRASKPAKPGNADGRGDTIVLSAADTEGNVVSWVNSNFAGWGSGITVPGYGFLLHNRGALFSLDPKSPNAIAPHKWPFNTLSAGMLMKDGKPAMTVTLMGGDMQAQGHAQLLVNILDLGANAQAAAEMGRFRHAQVANVLSLEKPLYELVGAQLREMGHDVRSVNGADVGGVQVIRLEGGVYRGASDPRKDGQAVGW